MQSPSIARTKVLHTEQYMRIAGLGSAQFGEAAVAMLSIHQMFSKSLVKGSMHEWEVKREQEHIVLDFQNQYLSLQENTLSSVCDEPCASENCEIHPHLNRITDYSRNASEREIVAGM